MWKVTGFSEAWACYESNNWHNQSQPHTAPSHSPSSLFLGLDVRPEKLRVWGITWSSCPLQRFMPAAVQMVLLFFLQNLISLSIPLLSFNRWHISTNRACLCCQCLQRSRKLSQTLQSQRCYPKKATTDTWQKNKMMFAKGNKERAHICPLDIMQYGDGF